MMIIYNLKKNVLNFLKDKTKHPFGSFIIITLDAKSIRNFLNEFIRENDDENKYINLLENKGN